MDSARFDRFVTRLGTISSRRGMLHGLRTLVLAGCLAHVLGEESEAGRRSRRTGSRGHRRKAGADLVAVCHRAGAGGGRFDYLKLPPPAAEAHRVHHGDAVGVDLLSDPRHCGKCGNRCTPGEGCAGGSCCPPNRDCGDECCAGPTFCEGGTCLECLEPRYCAATENHSGFCCPEGQVCGSEEFATFECCPAEKVCGLDCCDGPNEECVAPPEVEEGEEGVRFCVTRCPEAGSCADGFPPCQTRYGDGNCVPTPTLGPVCTPFLGATCGSPYDGDLCDEGDECFRVNFGVCAADPCCDGRNRCVISRQ